MKCLNLSHSPTPTLSLWLFHSIIYSPILNHILFLKNNIQVIIIRNIVKF